MTRWRANRMIETEPESISMRRRMIWSAQLLVIVLCALALKLYYSTATADELRWILAPTTGLVELLSGRQFEFESYMGYMSSDHRFVIAVPCAGVNFLLTAFLMLSLRRLWRERFHGISWRFIPVIAALAYVATLIANTVRICIALEIQRRSIELSWLTANQLHRLEGIVVYFGFLLLLFVVTERFEAATPTRLKRALLFPLLVYYATTLGIPLVNGSFQQSNSFWEHFAFVLVLPLLLIVPLTSAVMGCLLVSRTLTKTNQAGVLTDENPASTIAVARMGSDWSFVGLHRTSTM